MLCGEGQCEQPCPFDEHLPHKLPDHRPAQPARRNLVLWCIKVSFWGNKHILFSRAAATRLEQGNVFVGRTGDLRD